MKKTYNYADCKVVLHIPEDNDFVTRVRKASEVFMTKALFQNKQ